MLLKKIPEQGEPLGDHSPAYQGYVRLLLEIVVTAERGYSPGATFH